MNPISSTTAAVNSNGAREQPTVASSNERQLPAAPTVAASAPTAAAVDHGNIDYEPVDTYQTLNSPEISPGYEVPNCQQHQH